MEKDSVTDVRSSYRLEEDTAIGDLENYRKRGEMVNDDEESWDGEIVSAGRFSPFRGSLQTALE